MKSFKNLREELSVGLLQNLEPKTYSSDRKASLNTGKLVPGKTISFKQKQPRSETI